jgi:hypothetical protein
MKRSKPGDLRAGERFSTIPAQRAKLLPHACSAYDR